MIKESAVKVMEHIENNSKDVSIEMPSLTEIRKQVKMKIREDLVRFRTCCADPRASK